MPFDHLGPYQLVGKLGRGGMGTVYEGVHRESGEPAAVKLLAAALAQEEGFRVRFESEIETLRKLNHPNIVRLFGFGEQDGHLFYAMELVDGNSLEEELQRGRRFDWREAARIGIEMCLALRHAHDRGIVHRDIKPGNLLLTKDGHIKLSDFGIARLFGNARLTNDGNVLGTAEYMAPEQAEGRPVDYRADLYSLGALLYALLARRPVFRGRSLLDVLHKQRYDPPDPIRKHAPEVPEEFEHILTQLLEKEPERRIPNASILGRRLEEMLHALSTSPETMEASADWFEPGDPSPPPMNATVAVPPPDDIPDQPTLHEPAGNLPVTEVLTDAASHEERPEPILQISSPVEKKPAAPSTDNLPSVGRFIVVGEDELDQAVEEPIHHPIISLQTWALASALLSLGLIAWWFLRPPTADTLFDRIAAHAADKSLESLLLAEPDINDFVNRFPDDIRAGQLREYAREIDLYRLEKTFDRRVRGQEGSKGLSPIEQLYLEALTISRYDPVRAIAKLRAIVDLNNQPGDNAGPAGQCLTLARRKLDQLQNQVKKNSADQLAILKDRLHAADAMRANDPETAQAMYRAVIELYSDKPWAAEAVDIARKALNQKTPPKP